MLDRWIQMQNWWGSEEGASLVEYALLLVLIAVVVIVAVTQVGTTASEAIGKTDAGFP